MKNRPVRVMHIVLSLCEGGGAERLVYDMVVQPSEGCGSIVCCLDRLGPLGEDLINKGHKVYHVKRGKGVDLGLIVKIRKILINEKINVIHAHQYTPYFYGVFATLFLKEVRVIMTEHGRLYPEKFRLKRYIINPFLAKISDRFVAVSASTKRSMIKYDNFPAYKIEVIFNGVRFSNIVANMNLAEKRRVLNIEDGYQVIGTAARLEEVKNLPMLLRMFKLVLEDMPDTYLLIAGKGTKEKELKELALQLGISEKVLFLGFRSDLSEIYRLYDIFVLTSHTEGISVTLLEAMNTGIPTVATAVGGNPEVVIDGVTGCLVPLDDDKTIAVKIVELLRSPEKREVMGKNGVERVRDIFSFDGMLARYQQLYRESRI